MEVSGMKKKFSLVLIIILCSSVIGCIGLMIAPFKGATIKPKDNTLNIDQPSKVSRKELAAIKKIIITPVPLQMKDQDEIRMLSTMRIIIDSELEKSKRFKIISGNAFRDKQTELGMEINPSIMTPKELEEAYAKVGRALGCDALLTIYLNTQKVDIGKAFLTTSFKGSVDVPVKVMIDLSTTKTGESIWHQEDDMVYSSGEMGMKNTTADELKQMLYSIAKPIVDNFLSFFL